MEAAGAVASAARQAVFQNSPANDISRTGIVANKKIMGCYWLGISLQAGWWEMPHLVTTEESNLSFLNRSIG
jgi:hypothetical protein